MKRLTYSILALIISISSIQAQKAADAEKLITNFLTNAKTNAIKTNFKLTVTEKNAVNLQSSSGSFTMKGNKFVLEMDQLKAWYDGKTQWSYMVDNNEVSITEPTDKELGETNPMALLSNYKAKFGIRFSKTKSAQNHIIEMIPKVKNDDFSKVEVSLNKANGNLSSIKISDKKGKTTNLIVTNFQKGIRVADNIFTFDKSKYKGVLINDLR
ncbi:MAG TPA: outer membrane lipoprotein carrier protein LolA [Paludibacter sp.]|nr:outer membrane lipoprotein carrier protein LolA [Paludibacter sp.]